MHVFYALYSIYFDSTATPRYLVRKTSNQCAVINNTTVLAITNIGIVR